MNGNGSHEKLLIVFWGIKGFYCDPLLGLKSSYCDPLLLQNEDRDSL